MKKLRIIIPFGIALILIFGIPAGAGAGLLITLSLLWAILWVGLYFYMKQVHFYRDPKRRPDDPDPNAIVSPADGRVIYIREVKDGKIVPEKLGTPIELTEVTKFPGSDELREGWLMGVYMSPADVHFNYSPMAGKVAAIHRHHAKVNLPMVDMWEYINFMFLRRAVDLFAKKFHFENERATLLIERPDLKTLVVLIADKFVNKVRLHVEENEELAKTAKLGFIDRGSQADLFIARKDIEITARVGQKVYGGKTVVARVK